LILSGKISSREFCRVFFSISSNSGVTYFLWTEKPRYSKDIVIGENYPCKVYRFP